MFIFICLVCLRAGKQVDRQAGKNRFLPVQLLPVLAKKYRLTKKKDFVKLFSQGKFCGDKVLVLKVIANGLPITRCGFVVSLKVSKKASARNKIRRYLQEIVRLNYINLKSGFDFVLIVRPGAPEAARQILNESVEKLLSRADLLKKTNKTKPFAVS